MSTNITSNSSASIMVFLSNRSDANLTNNVNINSQFAVLKNGSAIGLTLIDDHLSNFNDGVGTRIALATLSVNRGDVVTFTSNDWAGFNYMNRCWLFVPSDFSYT